LYFLHFLLFLLQALFSAVNHNDMDDAKQAVDDGADVNATDEVSEVSFI
jgi:hypothetical protein